MLSNSGTSGLRGTGRFVLSNSKVYLPTEKCVENNLVDLLTTETN